MMSQDRNINHKFFTTAFAGKKTFAFSRPEIAKFHAPEGSALISINDTTGADSVFMDHLTEIQHGFADILWLRFDDCAFNEAPWMAAMNQSHAQEIVKFVEKNNERNIFVHCSGGISRSAGVASVLEQLGWNAMWLYRHHPNAHVVSLLKREFNLVPFRA